MSMTTALIEQMTAPAVETERRLMGLREPRYFFGCCVRNQGCIFLGGYERWDVYAHFGEPCGDGRVLINAYAGAEENWNHDYVAAFADEIDRDPGAHHPALVEARHRLKSRIIL